MNFKKLQIREKFDLLGPRRFLRGLGCVLIRGWCLPSGLLERELDGDSLASFCHNMRAGLNPCVVEEGC